MQFRLINRSLNGKEVASLRSTKRDVRRLVRSGGARSQPTAGQTEQIIGGGYVSAVVSATA